MTENNVIRDEDNPYRPTAPFSTGTIPRHSNRPLGEEFEGLHDFDHFPSAPPLEQMDQVSGYETVSFNAVNIPPPTVFGEMSWEDNSNNLTQPSHPQVSEKVAREALYQYAKKHCCYGTSVPRNMVITKLKYSSAFHYELQTYTEKRETSWKFVPYGGGPVDGAENGPPPLPWDIAARPSDVFKNEEKALKVPHTSSVKTCHRCRGSGEVTCTGCYGKGWVRCEMCSGNGYRSYGETKEKCIYCSDHGFGHTGQTECSKCNARGTVCCYTCDGEGDLLCYIRLLITWKVNTSEHIVENMALPERIVRFVSGQVAYEDEGPRVVPLQGFPDEAINMASAQLVHEHFRTYQNLKVLGQRQQVRSVPITSVHYEWRGRDYQFLLCGFENKVHAPDYPQTCCCCCCVC